MVTSIGSGVGRAILQSVHLSKYDYVLTGTSSVALQVHGTPVHLFPPTSDRSGFEQALIEAIRCDRPQLLLPGRDEDASVLAAIAPRLACYGTRVAGGSERLAVAALDKATSECLAPNIFVRTVCSASAALALAQERGWPLVLKPRTGFASRGVRLARDEGSLLVQMQQDEVAQEFLYAGSAFPNVRSGEHSVQLLLGPDSALLGAFYSVNELVDGKPTRIRTVPPSEEVVELLSKHLKQLGATGPWNFQGMRKAGGHLRFFEVNARMTGISGLRASLGFNEVDLLYDAFVLGRTPSGAPTYPEGVVVDARTWTRASTFGSADQQARV